MHTSSALVSKLNRGFIMGRNDNRRTPKMKRREAQAKKKARIAKAIAEGGASKKEG